MPTAAFQMPDTLPRAPWLQQRVSFALALFGVIYLAYAAVIAGNWYLIHGNWTEVPATFLRSETQIPIRRNRSVPAILTFSYQGKEYRVAERLPRDTAESLLRRRFDPSDIRTVAIKVRPETSSNIVVDPRPGILSALKWGILLLAAAAFVFKKGDMIARKLDISETVPPVASRNDTKLK